MIANSAAISITVQPSLPEMRKNGGEPRRARYAQEIPRLARLLAQDLHVTFRNSTDNRSTPKHLVQKEFAQRPAGDQARSRRAHNNNVVVLLSQSHHCFICEATEMDMFPVFKFRSMSKIFLITALPLLSRAGIAATDFATLQASIQDSRQHIETLESNLGRYNYQLLEPLEQLARIQLAANRFDDAESSIDKAIQIARFSEGLYSSKQYPLDRKSTRLNSSHRT